MPALKLRTKILVPVAGLILLVVVASLAIVNYVVRRQVIANVSTDLERAQQVFDRSRQRQLRVLIERARIIAETPYLKAAVETTDPSTVQGISDELLASVPGNLLIVTNENGRVLARVGAHLWSGDYFAPESLRYRGTFDDAEVGLYEVDGRHYQLVVVPIIAGNPAGSVSVLGMAAFGQRIDSAHVSQFRAPTNSEIVFVENDRVILTTLDRLTSNHHWNRRIAGNGIFTVGIDEDEYIVSHPAVPAVPGGDFALMRSVSEVLGRFLGPIESAILIVGLIAIIATIGFSLLIARGLVRPVHKLVAATDAVSQGNYDHPIPVASQDEIGHLAREFDQMRMSLRRQMAQLAERNNELESALQRLEQTQADLVQSEKLAATGKITAQLSHELNNPIHNIRSCLETARKKLPDPHAARELLDLAHEEVLRISELVRQMLDFYRPRPAARKEVHLDQIIEEVVKSSNDLLQQHHIRVRLDFQHKPPPLMAAGDQLKQVFLNLLVNAVDAMAGSGELKITSTVDNGFVALTFADTGAGIPPKNLPKIFEAFFTTKSQASGVGLGLSVSYGIVASHGGRIEVESEPGKGARFTVKLPLSPDMT